MVDPPYSPVSPSTRRVGLCRPIGWSPGTPVVAGAWLASAAIARLTGSPAVIVLLATVAVGVSFDIVAGWRAARRPRHISAVGPTAVTVGETVHLAILLTDNPRRWARWVGEPARDRRIAVHTPDGSVVTSVDVSSRTHTLNPPGTFPRPGVIESLRVDVEATGPIGLVWWRRPHAVDVAPIHVAPTPAGPAVLVERSTTTIAGPVDVPAGRHDGDVDGVRPYRPGDAIASVHWPSSMRADELIVHDRVATSEERWIVALDHPAIDGARLRFTLDEGLRLGHSVAVRDSSGDLHPIESTDDARRWSAVVCQATPSTGTPRPRRHVSRPEISHVHPVTRWAAGATTLTSLMMLTGALETPATMRVVVALAVVIGVFISLRIATDDGTRPLALRIGMGLAVAGAMVTSAVGAAHVDSLLAALRGPLPHLLILLIVLHGCEVVDRRTLRAHQAIALVVASYTAGLRIDGALGWWLAAWGAAFVISVLTTTRRPGTNQRHGPRASDLRRSRSAVAGARIVAWGGALAAATVALLSVVPIPDGPARLGLPALSDDAPVAARAGTLVGPDGSPTTGDDSSDRGLIGDVVGYPGFTETLDTSIRGTLGDEVVMRVRSPEPAFWRGQTFSDFDGRVWRVSNDAGRAVDGPVIPVPPTVGDAVNGSVASEELVQTYFVEQDLPNVVFAAYRPTEVVFDGTLWVRADGALRSDVTLTAGSVYTVVSERIQVTEQVLRNQGDVGALFEDFQAASGSDAAAPFLTVPPSTTRRTIDLATSLRAPDGNTYDTILAYQDWLAANSVYDLDAPVPAEGVDAVDDFLFGSRRGFCEQIATALTIMLRTQGVPARLVTGYVPGERDRVSGVWKVRGSDAHAWVEVWFPQTGWQAFDPTASVPLAGETTSGTVGGDLLAATTSSILSHRLEVAAAIAAFVAAWAASALVIRARRRARRGRWGLLQDRFIAISERDDTAPRTSGEGLSESPPTNPARARALTRAEGSEVDGVDLERLADLLDRAAFDPDWNDDDHVFAEARTIVATLERRRD